MTSFVKPYLQTKKKNHRQGQLPINILFHHFNPLDILHTADSLCDLHGSLGSDACRLDITEGRQTRE